MIAGRWLSLLVVFLLAVPNRADEELPADAKRIIQEAEKKADEILKKAEEALKKAQEEHQKAQEEVLQNKANIIAQLEALAARLKKEGKNNQAELIAERVEELKSGRVAGAQPNPGNLTGLRGQNDKVFIFDVTGAAGGGGGIWGTDIYTDDSTLASAAVHAGVLKAGERGAVKVTILAGQPAYQGTMRNGVTTGNWGEYGGSYKVEPYRRGKRMGGGMGGGGAGAGAMPDPGTLQNLRGQIGKSFIYEVTGNANGTIWGTGNYTDDSALATAAVHAGILQVGEKGLVKVTILAGQQAYQDSTANGVTSRPYEDWGGSYAVEKVEKKKK